MTTLHIEHAITDLAVWQRAFGSFAAARTRAGVLSHRARQPVDDDHWIVVDLDFADRSAAERFLHFLEESVWNDSTKSPALSGRPRTAILEDR